MSTPRKRAAERGFKEGDVILEVAGKNVARAARLARRSMPRRADRKNSVLNPGSQWRPSRFVAISVATGLIARRLRDGKCRRHQSTPRRRCFPGGEAKELAPQLPSGEQAHPSEGLVGVKSHPASRHRFARAVSKPCMKAPLAPW